jgi:hypothetical protein
VLLAAMPVVAIAAAAAVALPLIPSGPVPQIRSVISLRALGVAPPDLITADPAHVWVADFDGASITELDAATGARISTFGVSGIGPTSIDAIADDGVNLWAETGDTAGNAYITEISGLRGAVVRTIGLPSGIFGNPGTLAVNGSLLWVGSFNSLLEFSVDDGLLVGRVDLPFLPLEISVGGTHIWVAGSADAGIALAEADAATGRVQRTFRENWKVIPSMAAFGTSLWALSGPGAEEISPGDGKPLRTVTAGVDRGTHVIADGSRFWVVNSASVSELDAGSGQLLRVAGGPETVLNNPLNIAVAGGRAWAVNGRTDTVVQLTD